MATLAKDSGQLITESGFANLVTPMQSFKPLENQMSEEQSNQATGINAAFDKNVDVKDYKFHFKKDNLGNKRETIELKLGVPSVEGIVAILETGGKGLELLQAAVADVIASQARSILNENEAMVGANFPLDQTTWEFIANMPEAEKRGRGIPKEIWEDFAADYLSVMPGITGKTEEQITLAAKLLVNKFNSVKTNKPVIKKLKEQLAIYTNGSPNAEQYGDCVKFLDEKADALLLADEAAMLANL